MRRVEFGWDRKDNIREQRQRNQASLLIRIFYPYIVNARMKNIGFGALLKGKGVVAVINDKIQ